MVKRNIGPDHAKSKNDPAAAGADARARGYRPSCLRFAGVIAHNRQRRTATIVWSGRVDFNTRRDTPDHSLTP